MENKPDIIINESHHRQDINREREFNKQRPRYRFASDLLQQDGSGLKLVDVGGGAGEFAEIARSLNYSTTLLDGNANSIANEKTKGADGIQVDLTKPMENVPSGEYDVAVCLEVIEHIVTAELLVNEIFRILKPGGTFIVSTPNFGFLRDRAKYLFGQNVFEEGYHYRFYTKDFLNKMLGDAGFIKEESRSMGSALGVNLLLRLVTLGKAHISMFPCPDCTEAWMARTFIWKMRKEA